jgi:UDP-galactopyranose mutase
MVHCYGPHIFHTADERVWRYVQQFGTFRPYTNRVKAISGGNVYSLPVNLLTINQFFGLAMGPKEARAFIETQADRSIADPDSFEDQALNDRAGLVRHFSWLYTQAMGPRPNGTSGIHFETSATAF